MKNKFKKIIAVILASVLTAGSISIVSATNELNQKVDKNVVFAGVEDKSVLVGDLFEFKKDVDILVDGTSIGNDKLVITNSNGTDISKIPNVKILDTKEYVYKYKYLDADGKLHQKDRIITGRHTTNEVSINEISENKLKISYSLTNDYNQDIKWIIGDWGLIGKNKKQDMGILKSGETKTFEKEITLVPSFKQGDDVPDGGEVPEGVEDPNFDIKHINTDIEFAPSFFIETVDGSKLDTFSVSTGKYDTSNLIESRRIESENVDINVIIPNKNINVGDEIVITFQVSNKNSDDYLVKLGNWMYFGVYEQIELGLVKAGENKSFNKKIIITDKMLDSVTSKLKLGVNGFHFYDVNNGNPSFVKSVKDVYGINEYNINIDSNIVNGILTIDKTVANIGDIITLTINANDGYQLKEGTLKVITTSGIEIPLTQMARMTNGTFTFEMPAEDVTIFSEFELISVVTPPVVEPENPQPETGTNPTTGTTGIVGILGAMGLAGATTLFTRKRKNK